MSKPSRQLRRSAREATRARHLAGTSARQVRDDAIKQLKGERLLLRLRIAELEQGRLATRGVRISVNWTEFGDVNEAMNRDNYLEAAERLEKEGQ